MTHVEFRQITKSFGAHEVIPPLDLDIEKGEFIVLVGPSGCGKTTTLRILAGLETATSGTVAIAGRDVTGVRPGERDCAMVFQNYALYPHMSVRGNIGYAMKVHGTQKDEIDRRVGEAAALLGLDPYLDRKPANLSGGQRQRVAIGRALVRQPEVFLFDEPLSNLDAKLRVEMRAEIKMLQKRLGTTAVYVTHDQVEAMTMADRVVVMNAGRIEQVAAPIDLYEQPANRFVANFIGSPAMNFFTVAVTGGAVVLGDQRLALPPESADRLGDRASVIFGIRPEHMRPGRFAADLEILPDTLEPLGAHTLILGHVAGEKITAQVDPRFPAEAGKPCTVTLDMQEAHFFDPDTEQRL
ncbi:MAG: sn-glycerol-3-phosphate ABC transporter ATP-binding protein UgpC [Maritimibacter sp.]|nr:sn-glycerol-3-phosphate ABC transporter ATP-binding protein UgpC [Maritimibacter sp.]MCB1356463.1 sn-glycerol-3-phosphate ABC transporter ATP-binding protein UgpC [Maritimibacter sp.]